jgi:hypothetical protein
MEIYIIDLNKTKASKDILEAVSDAKFKELAHNSHSIESLLYLLNSKGFDNTKFLIRQF